MSEKIGVSQLWVTPTHYLAQRRTAQLGPDWLVVSFGANLSLNRFDRIVVEDGATIDAFNSQTVVRAYLDELKARLRPGCYDNLIVL